jgi:hypothetical protein
VASYSERFFADYLADLLIKDRGSGIGVISIEDNQFALIDWENTDVKLITVQDAKFVPTTGMADSHA